MSAFSNENVGWLCKRANRARFSFGIVVVVQIVEPDDGIAALEQLLRHERTNESGRSSHQRDAALSHAPRPMPKYSRPAARTVAGSYKLRPSKIAFALKRARKLVEVRTTEL